MRPTETFVCADCNGKFENATYVRDLSGGKVCDSCAHQHTLSVIEDCNDYVTGYGPSELKRGTEITGWTGRPLMTITSVGRTAHPWTVRSVYGKKFYCEAQTATGKKFVGWIGEGVGSNLRPKK